MPSAYALGIVSRNSILDFGVATPFSQVGS